MQQQPKGTPDTTPVLTGFGLGQLLNFGRDMNAMDQVVGIMLVIVVIGLLAGLVSAMPAPRRPETLGASAPQRRVPALLVAAALVLVATFLLRKRRT